MNTLRPRWSAQTKLVVSIFLLTFFIYLLFRIREIIPPLILAVILAYILSPIVNYMQERLRLRRALAILLAYLILVIVAIPLPLILVPPLAEQFTMLNLDLQQILQQAEVILGHQYNILGSVVDGSVIVEQVSASFQRLVEPFIGQTLGLVVDIIKSVVWMIIILVVSFYLIKDSKAFRQWLENLPPPEYRQDYIRLREEINIIWSGFFRGQLVLALVVSIMFIGAGFILGLPFALAMGILAGLLEFLPSIGHGIWLFIASIIAYFLGSTWIPVPNWVFMLIIIGLYLIFEQFDLNYLIPRIIGQSVRLPPLVILLGIVTGAVFAGVLGIPLAAPTIASARVLGRYVYANLLGLDPFVPRDNLQPPPDPKKWSLLWKRK